MFSYFKTLFLFLRLESLKNLGFWLLTYNFSFLENRRQAFLAQGIMGFKHEKVLWRPHNPMRAETHLLSFERNLEM